MKAMVQHRYGRAADVLRLSDVALPIVGDDEVLVEVHAAGIGPHLWHAVTGRPYLMVRLTGAGLRAPKAHVPRTDIAGTVHSVGPRVANFRPGDAVYGVSEGGLAEYACASPSELALKPANLTFEQAASVPVSACAALHGLRDLGGLRPGHEVLILGAAGGIGTFAVQIAKAFGAQVTGVCRAANAEFVRSLGADHVVDYETEDFLDEIHRYDIVLDLAGRRPLSVLRRALNRGGTLVIVGGEGGGPWTGGFGRALVRAPLLSVVTRQRLRLLISTEKREALDALTELIEAGKVTPVVTRTVPLSQTAETLRDDHEGHGHGKTVVTIQPAAIGLPVNA